MHEMGHIVYIVSTLCLQDHAWCACDSGASHVTHRQASFLAIINNRCSDWIRPFNRLSAVTSRQRQLSQPLLQRCWLTIDNLDCPIRWCSGVYIEERSRRKRLPHLLSVLQAHKDLPLSKLTPDPLLQVSVKVFISQWQPLLKTLLKCV